MTSYVEPRDEIQCDGETVRTFALFFFFIHTYSAILFQIHRSLSAGFTTLEKLGSIISTFDFLHFITPSFCAVQSPTTHARLRLRQVPPVDGKKKNEKRRHKII